MSRPNSIWSVSRASLVRGPSTHVVTLAMTAVNRSSKLGSNTARLSAFVALAVS